MKSKDIKPHIGIFGRRNTGKSSLINLLTGQDTAIVSDFAGTTTDPVKKSVEIISVGPAIIIDTAGIDDTGDLGKLRTGKTLQVINTIDMAILVFSENNFGSFENSLIREFNKLDIPYILIHNKSDIVKLESSLSKKIAKSTKHIVLDFSTINPGKFEDLTELIRNTIPENAYNKPGLFKDLINPNDIVLMVTPIDSSAPEGRMILPQVMAWRDLLDNNCICMSVKETELKEFFKLGITPKLVITDSQVFGYVSEIVPKDIKLTSFSIIFSRLKSSFEDCLMGTQFIDTLKDGDKILILESCTHHITCDDIGRIKIPSWLKKHTGKDLKFETISGLSEISSDVKTYKLVIQCGGCMVTRKQILSRLKPFIDAGIPVSNYGMTIAWVNGIFDRVTEVFKK
ncbi:MAG TPA: [FeFe] hydrogenase H-cluster maturation GTPase HydF [Bacteroidales bacterium]|nr:[FeFe] hydrogenase H-cluster maturation GTPase HydF [Bacteroidales bacterium]